MRLPAGFGASPVFGVALLTFVLALLGVGTSSVPVAHFGGGIGTARFAAPSLTTLYGFHGPFKDGSTPNGGLSADKTAALYGATTYGGTGTCKSQQGCGTIFKLVPAGGRDKEIILYSFQGGKNGTHPNGALIVDDTGSLYGTTSADSTSPSNGTVFTLTPSNGGYTQTVLYNFTGGSDGLGPVGGLIGDKTGALYGTTYAGGTGAGTVFKLTPSGGGYAQSVVYRFHGPPSDGFQPTGGLIADGLGALYGITALGGSGSCKVSGYPRGCGTIFKLTPSGSGYTEGIVYNFPAASVGLAPDYGLIADKTGALYGVTDYGGNLNACPQPQGLSGCGTVFKLTPSRSGYSARVLYRFKGGAADGRTPGGSLLIDDAGALYGPTAFGGTGSAPGYGTVYELSVSGANYDEKILYKFTGRSDGAGPGGGLIADQSGALFGETAGGGGATGGGTVFKLTH